MNWLWIVKVRAAGAFKDTVQAGFSVCQAALRHLPDEMSSNVTLLLSLCPLEDEDDGVEDRVGALIVSTDPCSQTEITRLAQIKSALMAKSETLDTRANENKVQHLAKSLSSKMDSVRWLNWTEFSHLERGKNEDPTAPVTLDQTQYQNWSSKGAPLHSIKTSRWSVFGKGS